MKKIFKFGCGCLSAVIATVILLIVIDQSCSSSGSRSVQDRTYKAESFKLPNDETIHWERKTAEIKNMSAREYLNKYLKENGLQEGFNSPKQTFCFISDRTFELRGSPSDELFIMRHANQIRRAALQALLKNLNGFAEFLNKQEEIKNGEKITLETELKLKNIVLKHLKVKTTTTDSKTVEESSLMLYQNKKLLEHILDGKDETWVMKPISVFVQESLSETDHQSFLQPFLNLLISDGLPVVTEHTAYSWDEKNKKGEVALLLIYKITPDKKAQ